MYDDAIALLNSYEPRMQPGRITSSCAEFSEDLHRLRLKHGESAWKTEILPACRAHPIFHFFSSDPYTNRAISKPRGYAGDAVMLDFVLAHIIYRIPL